MNKYFTKKALLEHSLFWLFMFLFVFDYHFIEDNLGEACLKTLLELLSYAVIVYINLLILIPFILKKAKVFWYVLSIVLTIILYIFILHVTTWENIFYDKATWRNIFSMVLNSSLFFIISSLYWSFQQWQVEREQKIILRSEKLEAELNFLRTQISPHFIFNVLNNIYTLILQNHENAAPMVAKLSTILRYVLYEGSEGEIVLQKEIELLKEYIDLHLLRKTRSNNIDFYHEGNLSEWKIAPMLLVNFIENAFKHSNIDNEENAWMKIHCEINDENLFDFVVENSFLEQNQSNSSGIGLQNVQRQLELYYPNRHSIIFKKGDETFSVQLKLQLTKK